MERTNPCGEQPLGPYEGCNLGSINLGRFVKNNEQRGGGSAARWWNSTEALEETTRITTRFLDDVIEINAFPLPGDREQARANRRIGLGVMGWAELLFELGVRYDCEEAMAARGPSDGRVIVASSSRMRREELAEERGCCSRLRGFDLRGWGGRGA